MDPRCASRNLTLQFTLLFMLQCLFTLFLLFLQLGSRWVVDLSPQIQCLLRRMFSSLHDSSGQPILLSDCHQYEMVECASNCLVLSCDALAIWRIIFCKNDAQQARHADLTALDDVLHGAPIRYTFQINGARMWWRILHVRSPTSGKFAAAYDVGFSSPSNCFCAKRAAHASTGV